jgi:lysozyme
MKLKNDKLIKEWEQLRLVAYKPTPNDRWTIGWGHAGPNVRPGDTISVEQAQVLFDSDVKWAVDAVNRYVKVRLNQNQFDALVSFTFNVGEGAFKNSTLLRKLNKGDYQGAAEQFPRWNKQKGKVLKGLTRRRAHEMELFLSEMSYETEASAKPSEVNPLKPLYKSKEMLGSLILLLTGGSVSIGGVLGEVPESLSGALPWTVVAVGVLFLGNRLWSRMKADR